MELNGRQTNSPPHVEISCMPLPEVGALCRHGAWVGQGWGGYCSLQCGQPHCMEAQFLCCLQAGDVCMSMAVRSRGASMSCGAPPSSLCAV